MAVEFSRGAEFILPNGVQGWCLSDPDDEGNVRVLLLGLYRRTVPVSSLRPIRIQELVLDEEGGGWKPVNPEDYYFKVGDTVYVEDEGTVCKVIDIDYGENYIEMIRSDGLGLVQEIEDIHPARCEDDEWWWQDIDAKWRPLGEQGELPECEDDDEGDQDD